MPTQEPSKSSNLSEQPSWIDPAAAAAAAKQRWQPWKEKLANDQINNVFEGEDKIKTRCDEDVQQSTITAWHTAHFHGSKKT